MARQQDESQSDGNSTRSAPGPRGHPILGSLLDFRRDLLQAFVQNWHTYGDVVRFRMGGTSTAYLIVHPDHVKHVLQTYASNYIRDQRFNGNLKTLLGDGLITSNGDLWRQRRKLIQPVLHKGRIAAMITRITEMTADALDGWSSYTEVGQPIDMLDAMKVLSLCIGASVLFGVDVKSNVNTIRSTGMIIQKHINENMLKLVSVTDFLPLPSTLKFKKALVDLDNIVLEIIKERKLKPTGTNDVLSMLLELRDEETGESLSVKELRDEVVTLLFASHETTANALAWACYCLSLHPEIDRRMRSEVSDVLGGRTPTAEDLPELSYTKMVFEEALRLYSPAWIIARVAVNDDTIGGYHIPRGKFIFLSPYLTHRHSQFWPNPEGFDPERFSPTSASKHPLYAYFPFGGGPRYCVGSELAKAEGVLILAMLAQRFHFSLVGGLPVVPQPLISLSPRDRLLMNIKSVV